METGSTTHSGQQASPPAGKEAIPPEIAGETASAFSFGPFFWAAAATGAFYAALPYWPVHRALAERYFCGHPMEYILTGLFFLGLSILVLKAVALRGERRALSAGLLEDPALQRAGSLEETVARIEQKLAQGPPDIRRSVLGQRLRDVCLHLRSRKSSAALDDHLKHLADVAAERQHAGYALVRTVTWAIPILGFLGTVIGITLAISNLTPEQLDKSLSTVTGGLGVAFDTTALALALSVVLVFASFLVERAEQRVLSRVEDLSRQRIAPLFPEESQTQNPLLAAEWQAAQLLLEKTGELISRQTALWNEALETTRQNWLQALSHQKEDFDAAVQSGLQKTLENHARQLEETRAEFFSVLRGTTEELRATVAESHAAQQEWNRSFGEKMEQLWGGVKDHLQHLHHEQREQMEQLDARFGQRVAEWQQHLQQMSETGREQMEELRRQGEVLLQLSAQEDRLARLQQRLTDNLQALQSTETFEETLHSLSAAVHLLTVKARPHAA